MEVGRKLNEGQPKGTIVKSCEGAVCEVSPGPKVPQVQTKNKEKMVVQLEEGKAPKKMVYAASSSTKRDKNMVASEEIVATIFSHPISEEGEPMSEEEDGEPWRREGQPIINRHLEASFRPS